MARIRTIKPEFWTDAKIVQLPYEARLLFIGLWNFCDDEGFLEYEPMRIQMQVLPGDNCDIELLIDLLVAADLLSLCDLECGDQVLLVNNFLDHQKISHPTPSKMAPEVSGKLAIPAEARRAVARKYGCDPGGEISAECYYCDAPGGIWWPKTSKGKPGGWVAFSNLELDYFEAESQGGENSGSNLVLACRSCNRSKGATDAISFFLKRLPENSGGLRPEGKGKERKGSEGERPTRFPDDLTSLPEDWREKAKAYWSKKGRSDLDPDDEFEKFEARSKRDGAKYLDWSRAWQTWYCNAVKFTDKPTRPVHRLKTVAELREEEERLLRESAR